MLVKLAGPIATVITGGLLYNQNYVGFQAVNKIIDETKIEPKDLIKYNDKDGKDRVLGVEDNFKKVLGRVGNVEGKVDTVEHSMYHFMKVAMDKQDSGGDKNAE